MEKIEQDNPKKILGYEVVDSSVTEKTDEYYTDIYNPGEVKEQLIVGQEVAKTRVVTGVIDTSDSSIPKVDNIYSFTIPDPREEIFAFSITFNGSTSTGMFTQAGSISDTTAWNNLVSDFETFLGENYSVVHNGGGVYTMNRIDFKEFSLSRPSGLVRKLRIAGHNEHTKTTLTIDGIDYIFDGNIEPNIATAITDFIDNDLPSSYYGYTKFSGDPDFIIARTDALAPVISVTYEDRYTTSWTGYDSLIGPDSDDLGGTDGADSAPAYKSRVTVDGVVYEYTLDTGLTWTDSTYSYVGYGGTFNIRNINYRGSALSDLIYGTLPGTYTTSGFTLDVVNGSDRNVIDFEVYKNDYTSISVTGFEIEYPIDSGLTITTTSAYNGVVVTETNNKTTVTNVSYTEIATTFTVSSNNYFIQTNSLPNNIQIMASSSLGDSNGSYSVEGQSCTAKYSSNTFEVPDKVFKTSAGDFGNVVLVKKGGFVMNWTTTVSNKLTYTCEN